MEDSLKQESAVIMSQEVDLMMEKKGKALLTFSSN